MGDDTSKDKAKSSSGKGGQHKKGDKQVKKSSTSKDVKASAKAVDNAAESDGIAIPKQVDLMWTIALVVVAFVIGFFARGAFLDGAITTVSPVNSLSSVGSGADAGAPPLSDSEMKTDQLPPGHPVIGGDTTQTGGSTTQTGSSSAQGSVSSAGGATSEVPASGPLTPGGQSVEVKGNDTQKKP